MVSIRKSDGEDHVAWLLKNSPSFAFFVLGLPHVVTLAVLRLALIAY